MPSELPTEPNSVIQLLQAMLSFDTVTPRVSGRWDSERELGEWLYQLASGWQLTSQFLPLDGHAPNLLITHAVDQDAPWLVFDSHLDTVGHHGMTVPPLGSEIRDGRIYGRGACDTKGTGAAMLWALKKVAARQTAACNLALLFTVCEEDHQQGARAFAEKTLPTLPWNIAGMIVGEPTGMQAVAASNGFVRWQIETVGRAAHSSTPWLGRNAIVDMARVVDRLEQQHIGPLNAKHPLTGAGTCSINQISGGTQLNIVPENCAIGVDQRITPGQTPEEVLEQIRTLLAEIQSEDSEFNRQITNVESAPPFDSLSSRKLGETVAGTLTAAGIPSSVTGAPYTTNANHYAQHNLPCVILGPGDIALAHTHNESIGVEELELGVQGYRTLMESR